MLQKKKYRDSLFAFGFILPSFLFICIFSLIPIVMDVYYSFTKYNVLQPAEWVGLVNYARIFKDAQIWQSLVNTLIYTAVTVPIQTFLALVIGAVLASFFKNLFGRFIKSALFVPVIASSVLVGTLFSLILSNKGVVNEIIRLFGGAGVNWLGSTSTAMISVCITAIWKNVGYFLVIYYTGILSVPNSLYEAAEMDGASKMQQFFFITVPSLRNVTYLVVTLGTIWSFQVFDIVYTMTGGGPGMATQTLVLSIYKIAFREYNMGYASAVALLLFAFVMIITVLQKLVMHGDGDE